MALDADQPRPRARRELRRRGDRHVRRPVVEQAPAARAVRAASGCRTPRRCSRRSRGSSGPRTTAAGVGGRPPDPRRCRRGCPFAPRCRNAADDCRGRRAAAGGARARPPLGVLAPRPGGGGTGVSRRARPAAAGRASSCRSSCAAAAASGAASCTRCRACPSTCSQGETLGIVGETGSGKSTLARAVMQAPRPKAGAVVFRGTDLVALRGARLLRPGGTCRWCSRTRSARWTRSGGSRDLVEEPLIAYRTGRREPPGGAGWTRCSTWSAWTRPGTAAGGRASCPAARPSGSPSPARWRCPRR